MPADRLQKVLAAAGVASRRGSEALIAAGRVRVDGVVAGPGMAVDPAVSRIEVDGRPIAQGAPAPLVHLVVHKPAGVTATVHDRHAVQTVLDLVPRALLPAAGRLYPVGRLDQDSEGLLLLTNDGPWADRVLHPRYEVEREYALALRVPLSGEQARALGDGIALEEGTAVLHHLRPATQPETGRLRDLLAPPPAPTLAWYRATLRQGWKRQVRRMLAATGSPIERLVRVRIGPVRLERLASGAVRSLTPAEVRQLGAGHVAHDARRPDARGPVS